MIVGLSIFFLDIEKLYLETLELFLKPKIQNGYCVLSVIIWYVQKHLQTNKCLLQPEETTNHTYVVYSSVIIHFIIMNYSIFINRVSQGGKI
jgi:hypothetical protein